MNGLIITIICLVVIILIIGTLLGVFIWLYVRKETKTTSSSSSSSTNNTSSSLNNKTNISSAVEVNCTGKLAENNLCCNKGITIDSYSILKSKLNLNTVSFAIQYAFNGLKNVMLAYLYYNLEGTTPEIMSNYDVTTIDTFKMTISKEIIDEKKCCFVSMSGIKSYNELYEYSSFETTTFKNKVYYKYLYDIYSQIQNILKQLTFDYIFIITYQDSGPIALMFLDDYEFTENQVFKVYLAGQVNNIKSTSYTFNEKQNNVYNITSSNDPYSIIDTGNLYGYKPTEYQETYLCELVYHDPYYLLNIEST